MNVTPLEKLHKDAVSVTVLVMFYFLSWLVPRFSTWISGQTLSSKLILSGVAALAVYVGSRPVYATIASLLASMAKSCTFLKRRYLGRGFLHGTWYGILRTKRGHLRVFVEQYEQELDGLTIKGDSFRLPVSLQSLGDLETQAGVDRLSHLFRHDANWTTLATNVNPRTGEIYCFYRNNVIRKPHDVDAVGHFNIDYGPGSVPVELRGHAIDVDAGIELAREYVSAVLHGKKELSFSALESIAMVRLSYDRVVKVRRERKIWFFKWFSEERMTTEEAKRRAIRFFSQEIEEELKRHRGSSQLALST